MTIQFMCPNGHTLSAPDHQAGKEGKGPKCESAFLVPELEEFADLEAESGNADASAAGHNAETPAETGTFFFLCPNGHKLSGPASLKGKPGQCPHCDSKFMIPSDDEGADQESELAPADEPAGGADVPFGNAVQEGAILAEAVPEISAADLVDEPMAPPIDGAHPLGAIFYQLNSVLDEDRVIELLTNDDETIVAEKISLSLSQSDYAVLAHIDDDDVTSIITVPWSSVKRATIRKVTELPEGWFR